LSIYDFSPRGFTAKFSINSILKKKSTKIIMKKKTQKIKKKETILEKKMEKKTCRES
jgi:hypothetical protein